jgi:hypothetical protein
LAISIPDALPSQPTPAIAVPGPLPNSAKAATDTVKLSEDAQIRLLTQQGQSPDEIAQNLGVAISTIEGYLGVVVASVTPAPPTPEPQRGASPVTSIPSRG